MKARNHVELMGNVGANPEVRTTTGGTTIANFQVATNYVYTDRQSGEKVERTEWHRLVAFGKLAEIIRDHVTKGTAVFVEGRLQTRKWEDSNNVNRYTTEIIIDGLHLLPGAPARGRNTAGLIGNVGADPEVRYTASGTAVANFQVATNFVYKDRQSGESVEKTEWHRLVAFGKLAEIISERVTKGTAMFVEGRLQTRKWEDSDNVKRYTTEIVVEDFSRFANGNGKSNGNGGSKGGPAPQAPEPTAPMDDFDDDIPF